MNAADLWGLEAGVEREAERARREGYFPLDVGHELERARRLLADYGATKSWAKGYGGRAETYDLGFDAEREALLLQAREALLRAKGALIALKLPAWTREFRYFYEDGVWGTDGVESFDERRGVVFMSGRNWALQGFPESQDSLWFRCTCRPTAEGIRQIERYHAEGKRVGTYMSGGMMAITFALLPDSEDDWTDEFMRQYAGHYWHGTRERFWGARGAASEWGNDVPRPMDFSRWMTAQLEFAHRIGFDFVHLDEAFGSYPEVRELSEANPNFVVCPNNLSRMYLDEEGWRFGWAAMGESLGDPSRWDEFNARMRARSREARNMRWWGWHTYTPFQKPYQDLSYATTLANRGTDVSHSDPSPELVAFSRRSCHYIYGDGVDVFVRQEAAKALGAPASLRTIANRKVLAGGREELVVHLLNTDPGVRSVAGTRLEVDLSGLRVRRPAAVTFVAPGSEAKALAAEIDGERLRFEVPVFRTWGMVVVGEPLFPAVELRLASRGGRPVAGPLDNAFVPGEAIEVEAVIDTGAAEACAVDLHLPEGWSHEDVGGGAGTRRRYRILPRFAHKDRGYAVTAILRRDGQTMPCWPLSLQAKDRVGFRLIPPMVESPRRRTSCELEVVNRGGGGTLRFALEPPAGWGVDASAHELRLAAGETRRIPVHLTPPDCRLRFWDLLDVDIDVPWTLEGWNGSARLRVRVFPTRFTVYAQGAEKMILHSYPNLGFIDDLEAAKAALTGGGHVALWLVAQDPRTYGPVVDEVLSMGGGVVWMGEPFPGANCPVTLEGSGLTSKTIRWVRLPDEPLDAILAPARRKRSVFESETGFRISRVKAKEWGAVVALWDRAPKADAEEAEETPAAVISRDPKRRIVCIGSDLEATSERAYLFEERRHHESHWFQSYVFYSLLTWASGAYTP